MPERLYRARIGDRAQYVIERDGRGWCVEGDPLGEWRLGDETALDTGSLYPPIVPGKIIGIGRNYRAHAAERASAVPAEPIVFLKPPSAVIGPGEPIVLPAEVGRVDHEAELGVVIGRTARRVKAADAHGYVFGLTCVNDVTARAMQDRGFQFSHVKGFDTFCPIGPCVLLQRDTRGIAVEGLVNGVVRQQATTDALIFPVEDLIEYVSAIMTLHPGDVIATGTPAGVGALTPGDIVTVRVGGVGELTNPVVAA